MLSMSYLSNLWQHTSENFRWHDVTVHSHAVALFCVYLLWYVKWNLPLKAQARKDVSPPPSPTQFTQVASPTGSTTRSVEVPASPVFSVSSDESENEKAERASADETVAEACPEATSVERERFLTARGWDVPSAIRTLRHFLDWNSKHEGIAEDNNIKRKNTENLDKDIWTQACTIAMKAAGETGEPNLPQVIRTHRLGGTSATDVDGHRVFQIMPAQLDDELAQGSTYALATAIFLNLHLDRNGSERITVCMDVRAGQGWRNIHAMRQIPFMKDTTTLLLSLFPERLHRCLVYPVPPAFLWVWTVVSKIVDTETREKIVLLAGPNKIVSPPPLEGMIPHLGKEVAELLEESRVADFKED